MAKQDEELKLFVGQEIEEIRSATAEEYDRLCDAIEEEEEPSALMVAVLKNKSKMFLISDRNYEDNEEKGTEVALAETPEGEIIEIPDK